MASSYKGYKCSDTKFGFKCTSFGVQKQKKSLSLNCFSGGSHWHQAAYLWRCLMLKIATYVNGGHREKFHVPTLCTLLVNC